MRETDQLTDAPARASPERVRAIPSIVTNALSRAVGGGSARWISNAGMRYRSTWNESAWDPATNWAVVVRIVYTGIQFFK